MGLFSGKVVIVTGAGGGLGRSYALAFAREGGRVVVNDLGGTRDGSGADSSMADRVVAEIRQAGGEAIASHDSVATVEGGCAIAQAALRAFGRVDVLVNNAGILRDKTLVKMEEEMWDLVVQVHTKQLYAVTRPVLAHMIERGGGGKIVNTTSLAGLLGNYGQTNYSTAKAGVAGFTRTLALEARKHGIQVNAVAPVAKTRMTEDVAMVPAEMKPEHVTPMVLYLCSAQSDAVTGRVFGVHGNQVFEYKTVQTPGVTKAGTEPWTVAEITARFQEISRDTAAPASAAPGPDEVTLAFGQIPRGFRPAAASGWEANIHWAIRGASDQTLTVSAGACTHKPGLSGSPTCTVKTDKDSVIGMFGGTLDPTKAFLAGKLVADNLPDMMKMATAFDFKAIGKAIADAKGGAAASAPKGETKAQAIDLRKAIGRRYSGDFAMVDREWIRQYALATNDPNPRYLEGDVVAPPLFPVRLFLPLMFRCPGDPEIDLDMLKLVHGEQDMTWHGPIRPDEIVNLRAVLESIAQKSKGCVCAWRLLGIVDGQTRVEARMSLFVRGQMLPGVEPGTEFGVVPPVGAGEPVGEPVAVSTTTVAMDQPKRYAAASLDDNPIHVDEKVAQAAGHPTVILHGLCTMAFAARGIVDEILGGDPTRLRRFAVRFSRPVLPGWVLTTRIWEAGTTPEGRRALQVETANADGQNVITNGWAEIDPA